MPKKNLELKLDTMAFGGEALASQEGKKVFVPWGVPGDWVKVELVEEKKDFARARILEILEKSSHRQEPPCPYFFKCGGCQWQHLQYESQVFFKQELLRTALQRIGKISHPNLLNPIPAPSSLHYRNKIRLQVSKKGLLGFYKAHSKEVVEIDACEIAESWINEKIPEAKQLARELFKKDPGIFHEIEIFQTGNKKVQVKEVGAESHFSQANQTQNEILKKRVLESLELSGNERILELFAGDGNFTFEIAKKSKHIIAVESNSRAILLAEERTRKSHSKNIEFVESSAHRYLVLLPKAQKFDRILLDPPRMGMEQGIENLVCLKAPVILYISCDPATLARDVKELLRLGYKHEFSQVIDMFPQTYHVESITRLKIGAS